MIKKYLASGRSNIREIEYDRETESFLYFGTEKTAKRTKVSEHFNTYAEAYQWLMDRVCAEIRMAQRDVQLWQSVQELIVEKHADAVEEELLRKEDKV